MYGRTVNILMTGAGAPGAAGILKCLHQDKSFHIIVADANPNAVGQYINNGPIAIGFEHIPFANDSSFADALLDICRKKNINLVLPLVTKELIPLAQHIKRFEQIETKVLVSPLASLEIANNKSRLYEFLQWRGIAVPEFRIVETVEQFKKAVLELGYPERPVCFKPSVSNGSRGFRIISEQMNELDLLFNHKPTSTYIGFNDAVRILSSGTFPELLVSEYLPGDEYSVDCLANHGESVLIVPRLRKRIINGISVEGEFIKEEKIISYCIRIIKELQLHGNIGIQVKKSATDEFLILEINPRVQGTISAALGAGINLPVLAIKQELGLPISSNELNVKWGTKFSRYWQEVFY
ncbi:MAG: ATP-grasp domain-containing protein [Sphingobacteriales bacterium]|nr:ATP-grasp domain-containing protein [Sphingobacteriales bacterium]